MAYLTLPPEFIPEVSTVINWIMSFTPLLSYGTTVLSIRRKKSSQGFSIDICATMLMSSSLRIFYYFNDPFEISLLRQCFIMIFIQLLLLKVALKYRDFSDSNNPSTHLETYESNWLELWDRFVEINEVLLPEDADNYLSTSNSYNMVQNVFIVLLKFFKRLLLFTGYVIYKIVCEFLRLFDTHYIRPFKFWQWKKEYRYWRFLVCYLAVISLIQLLFNGNEYLGIIFGSTSFLLESMLPLPQIMLFQRLQTVEGFKTILLLSWLGGDLTKISYLMYGTSNVGLIFIIAALFQMSLNLIIAYLFFYYKRMDLRRGSLMRSENLSYSNEEIIPMTRIKTNSALATPSTATTPNMNPVLSFPMMMNSAVSSPISSTSTASSAIPPLSSFSPSQIYNPYGMTGLTSYPPSSSSAAAAVAASPLMTNSLKPQKSFDRVRSRSSTVNEHDTNATAKTGRKLSFSGQQQNGILNQIQETDLGSLDSLE